MNKHRAHLAALLSLLLSNWIYLIADIAPSHQGEILNAQAPNKALKMETTSVYVVTVKRFVPCVPSGEKYEELKS